MRSERFTAPTTEGSSCYCLYTHATLTLLTQAVRAESTEDYQDNKTTLTQECLGLLCFSTSQGLMCVLV